MLTIEIASALLGALAGLILGLTGAGGAIIAVPLLIFGLHLTVVEAAPVALFAVGASAAIGAMIAWKKRKLRYRAAALIALAGALASPIGIFIARKIPDVPLLLLFAAVLFYVAFQMLRESMRSSAEAMEEHASAPCQLDELAGRLIWTNPCARALALSGVVTGFLSGLLGVGGGFVIVPALRKASNLSMQHIVPTSLAVIAVVSVVGVASSAAVGGLNWLIAVPFVIGAVAGMLLAGAFAQRFSGPRLQQVFAVLAAIVAASMVAKGVMALAS
jgi:uncharacterized membrane protein YfcA